ncbi:MAG: bacteriohemerythrin [Candidatus Thorarchaeota archaeon]|nr:bacteriohemerythrin [Candidatus Thorarchaeota archaeon]
MANIEWYDSFSVGINLIDEQHKELLGKINALNEAVDKHQGIDKILNTLTFLYQYTDVHFSTEEKYMKELDYPGKKIHMEQHIEFFEMIETMRKDFEEDGATRALGESISTYLGNWLITHIKSIDFKFGEFLRETGHAGINA